MKIVKVTYARTFPTGPYMNEKIGLEADIDGSVESVSASLAILKEMAEDFHKKSNPHLYQEQEKGFGDLPEHKKTQITFGPPPTIEVKRADQNDMLMAIQTAATFEDLATYKTIANSDTSKEKKLYNAYCLRLKQLTNGE